MSGALLKRSANSLGGEVMFTGAYSRGIMAADEGVGCASEPECDQGRNGEFHCWSLRSMGGR